MRILLGALSPTELEKFIDVGVAPALVVWCPGSLVARGGRTCIAEDGESSWEAFRLRD